MLDAEGGADDGVVRDGLWTGVYTVLRANGATGRTWGSGSISDLRRKRSCLPEPGRGRWRLQRRKRQITKATMTARPPAAPPAIAPIGTLLRGAWDQTLLYDSVFKTHDLVPVELADEDWAGLVTGVEDGDISWSLTIA